VHPSTNKKASLPALKQCIHPFKNLSMIVLIYRLGKGYPTGWHPSWMRGRSGLWWNEGKDLAISQLEGSSVGCPKKLKVVTLWNGDKFGPELAVEVVV